MNKDNLTNEQILKQTIEKAVKNGFDLLKWMNDNKVDFFGIIIVSSRSGWIDIFVKMADQSTIYLLIFSHDFAKTFWGEKIWCEECGELVREKSNFQHCEDNHRIVRCCFLPAWQYHLREQVISEDKIKYLNKGL